MNNKTTLMLTAALAAILLAPFTQAQNLDLEEMLDELEENMVEIPGKNYFISKYEVTQALWEGVMGELPEDYRQEERNPKFPIKNIDAKRAESFLGKLTFWGDEDNTSKKIQGGFRLNKKNVMSYPNISPDIGKESKFAKNHINFDFWDNPIYT